MDKNSFKLLGVLLGYLLIISSIMRLIFIGLNFSNTIPLSTYLHSILLGIRFDLSLNTVLLFPSIILLPFLSTNFVSKGLKIYFLIISFITILVPIIDAQYYSQMGNRFDLYAIKHFQFIKDHLAMLNMGGITIISILLLLAGVKLSLYFWERLISSIKINTLNKKMTLIQFFVMLLISVIFIRGGLQHRPLKQSQSIFSNYKIANDSVTNSIYRLYYLLDYYFEDSKNF